MLKGGEPGGGGEPWNSAPEDSGAKRPLVNFGPRT